MKNQISAKEFELLKNKKDYSIIFGGTFDPIHEGHIQDIKFLIQNSKKLYIAPTSQNPWKSNNPTSLNQRIEMIKIALNYENISHNEINENINSAVKIITSPYVYSVDIVNTLKKSGETQLLWAIGEDLKNSSKNWKDWDKSGVPFLILPLLEGFSATSVRNNKIPPHVAIREFINSQDLYKN